MSLKEFDLGTHKVVRYIIDIRIKPVGVVFGKFSPFTGPKGHGKLVEFAQKQFGKDNVIIVSPTRTVKDDKVDIFTDEQKEAIIRKANPDIEFHRIKSGIPPRMFTRVIDLGYERPVFIVGEDREDDFKKFFIEYNKANKPIEDMTDEDFGKGEYLVVPRSDEDTSATKVRKALINNDKKLFIKLTGFDEEMFTYMKSVLKESVIDFNKYYFMG